MFNTRGRLLEYHAHLRRSRREKNVKHAAPLRALKEDPENSLAAILTLNTVANTIGATGAGAQALVVFGDKFIAILTAIFTITILVVSEVIPKSLGAIFSRQLATFVATILPLFVKVLKPFVWVSDKITQLIKANESQRLSHDELTAIADLGRKEGLLNNDEFRILKLKFRSSKSANSDG